MVFGRHSKPYSHWSVFSDQSLPTERIKDPTDNQCIVEYRCVNKDGKRGQQTVFPPSQRYDAASGTIEDIRFEEDSASAPVFVKSDQLYRCFRKIGATALLVKHFPADGRHDFTLAAAGTFAAGGLTEADAAEIIEMVFRHSGGNTDDSLGVLSDVTSVYETHASGSGAHLFGYRALTKIVPKAVVDVILELLELNGPQHTYALTDLGNAQRLVDKFGENIRYCVDDGSWCCWDGVRWAKDHVRNIRELAKT